MVRLIKWTAITAAVITGASFAYSAIAAARRKVDQGLAHAEQAAEDAKHVLASTQQALTETQEAVRHLRATVS